MPSTTSAVRGGAYLGAASVVGIALNYAFLVFAGRLLGSDDYGDLAAILGLVTIVLLPTGALQMAVSREVSRSTASGAPDEANSFATAALRVALLATVPLMAICALLAVPASQVLKIDTGALSLAAVSLGAAFFVPSALGVIQGQQRFAILAVISAAPFAARLVALCVVAFVGATLLGTVGAVVVGALAAMALSLFPIRALLTRAAVPGPSLRPFGRYLVPVVVGLIGMSLLVNIDVIIVNARFEDELSGVYAAAAAFGRVAYFLPATILAVLFPRTAARQARGEETDDILGRSLIVTAVFCVALASFYVVVAEPLVRYSFGSEFEGAAQLLPLFALEMMLVSCANVLVGFHLSRGETRFAWIVAACVPIQAVALATIPDTLREVIWVNVAVVAALLVLHEIVIGSSLPALRAGVRRLRHRAG